MPELMNIPASVWGSLPGWGLFIVVVGYIVLQNVKNKPVLEQQKIEERLAIKGGYTKRITDLEEQVAECRRLCDQETKALQDQLMGMQRQHVQEQISLINAIISSIDAPELKALVKSLETVQAMSRLSAAQPAANEAS